MARRAGLLCIPNLVCFRRSGVYWVPAERTLGRTFAFPPSHRGHLGRLWPYYYKLVEYSKTKVRSQPLCIGSWSRRLSSAISRQLAVCALRPE
jgi:hypothetical protein